MIPIRREDKEFIQALCVLGAIFGACLGVILVMHFSDRAHETHTQQTEYTQTQAALVKLQTTVVNPSNPIANENVLDQVQKQLKETPAPAPVVEKNFWVRISRVNYLGLCTGACIVGAVAGYSSLWLVGWVGTIIVLYTIRLLYLMIRVTVPNTSAAKRSMNAMGQNNPPASAYQRDDGRILPVLVKLFFLLLVILGILSGVVWHLTQI
jgi:hypothetical protein